MPDLGIGETIASFLAVEAGYSAAVYAGTMAIINGAIYAGAMYGLGAAYQALNKVQAPAMQNRIQLVRASTATRKIIYGEVRCSGALVFVNSNNGNNNLHMVVALAAHECEEIGTIYFNEDALCDTALFDSPAFDPNKTDYAVGDIVYVDQMTIKGAYLSNVQNSVLSSGVVCQRTNVIWRGAGTAPITDQNAWRIIGNEKYYSMSVTSAHTEVVGDDGSGNSVVNTVVDSFTYTPIVAVNRHLGTLNQSADTDLIANCPDYWTGEHKLTGVCYIYVNLTWYPSIWSAGIPNISAVIKGKNNIFDPRTVPTMSGSFIANSVYQIVSLENTDFTILGASSNTVGLQFTATGLGNGTGTASIVSYSTNWALCVSDYLLSTIGLNIPVSELDIDLLIAAANISDESILVGGPTLTSFNTVSDYYQPRYTCQGIIDTASKPMDILTNMCSAGAGTVIWTSGLYSIYAGAYESPSASLNESDLRDVITIHPRVGKQDLFNTITGTYFDPNQFYQATNFIPQTSPEWVIQDGGTAVQDSNGNWIYTGQLIRNIDCPFTADPFEVQRTSLLTLRRARLGIIVDFPAKFTALPIKANSVITLSIALMNWINKEFRVINWKMAADGGGIDLVLQEASADSYSFNPATDLSPVTLASNSGTVATWTVQAPNSLIVAITPVTVSGSVTRSATTFSWQCSDPFVKSYTVQLNGVDYATVVAPTQQYVFTNLVPATYTFGVIAVNSSGAKSQLSYSTITITTPNGTVAGSVVRLVDEGSPGGPPKRLALINGELETVEVT